MPFLPSLQEDATVLNLYAQFGQGEPAINTFFLETITKSSELSRVDRELLAAFVSGLNQCTFCVRTHGTAAILAGKDKALLEALYQGNLERLDTKLKPIFELAKVTTLSPHTVQKSHISAILNQDWSEQAVYDAMLVIAAFNFANRMASASGVEITETRAREIASLMVLDGYEAMEEALIPTK